MKNRVRTEQDSAYSTRSRFFHLKFILDFTKAYTSNQLGILIPASSTGAALGQHV